MNTDIDYKPDLVPTDYADLYVHRRNRDYQAGLALCHELISSHNAFSNYNFMELYAFFLHYTKHYADSFRIYKKIHYECPIEAITKLCNYNIKFPVTFIESKYIGYSSELVNVWSSYLSEHESTKRDNNVTLLTTTCKRFDLFQKTVNSFIACCLDPFRHDSRIRIKEWIVIDDNSTEHERESMQEKYPFMRFIFKTPAQKGHARSLNLALRQITTPYVFLLEDDWQFYYMDAFMNRLLRVIEQNPDVYKQALVNSCYCETPDQEFITGGVWLRSDDSAFNYVEHEYAVTDDEKRAFVAKWGNKPSSSYWPHFSLRPGLSDMSMFKHLGEFDEDVSHFEMKYAYGYVAANYKTCFLPGMICKHIGKLTSQRGGINAYVLNSEAQFSSPNTASPLRSLDIQCINLSRRPERYKAFCETMKYITTPIHRFEAVDGKSLKMTPQIYNLFDTNDYHFRTGIVGCALSHLQLWMNHLYFRGQNHRTMLMVMEDDLMFNKELYPTHEATLKFEQVIADAIEYMDESNVELLFVQYTARNNVESKETKYVHIESGFKQAFGLSLGGTGCYIISDTGIEKMFAFINETGMTNAIDTVMQKATTRVKTAYMQPQHVILELNAPSSDIQFNHESCYAPSTKQHIISEIEWLYDQYKLIYKKDYVVATNPISDVTCAYTYFYILERGIYVCLLADQVPAHLVRCRPQQRLWNKVENRYVLHPLDFI